MPTTMRHTITTFAAALILVGCGGESVSTYTVPKPERAGQPAGAPETVGAPQPDAQRQQGTAPQAPAGAPMSQQTLPASQLSAADNPEWTIPEGWREQPAGPMRRATFAIGGPGDGSAEVAVTAFPGDLGGLLANVNRWRRQLGLGPVGEAQLGSITDTETVAGRDHTLVRVDGNGEAMRVVILRHAGDSWFFKLTGDAPTVAAQEANLRAFARSVRF